MVRRHGEAGGSVTLESAMTDTPFRDPDDVLSKLSGVAYLADERIATAVFVADRLGKPVLCEGPAGVGKTELAKSVAAITGRRLIRLQCYEGLDESKALYEWNYKKQLLRIQAEPEDADWEKTEADIFDEDFLLERPLLAAIRSAESVVLLVDEVDRLEVETEALLLEILSDFQVSIPELGTVVATSMPSVYLTSNNTRELSEALKRRCVFLDIDYPTIEREQAIIEARIPGIGADLAANCAEVVSWVRSFELKKPPSVSETLDWARTLLVLGRQELSREDIRATLNLLLKYSGDIEKITEALRAGRS
jgi:MoxR-like ATPase